LCCALQHLLIAAAAHFSVAVQSAVTCALGSCTGYRNYACGLAGAISFPPPQPAVLPCWLSMPDHARLLDVLGLKAKCNCFIMLLSFVKLSRCTKPLARAVSCTCTSLSPGLRQAGDTLFQSQARSQWKLQQILMLVTGFDAGLLKPCFQSTKPGGWGPHPCSSPPTLLQSASLLVWSG
jgi:hypothetical protein